MIVIDFVHIEECSETMADVNRDQSTRILTVNTIMSQNSDGDKENISSARQN